MQKVVIFDLDHTLLKHNSSIRFGQYLFRTGQIPKTLVILLITYYFLYKIGFISQKAMQQAVFKKFFFGKNKSGFNEHVKRFLELELKDLISDVMVEKLNHAKQEKHYTVILSSSPDFLVQPIAESFAVDHWQATGYETKKGTFSHIASWMTGLEKAEYVQQLSKHKNIPLNQFTAYSDCLSDLPLLQIVGYPIAVNPNRKLRKLCKNLGIRILYFCECDK